ncbi:hypothetical protein ACJROX_08825 [Pseudalkalibacillus sp. A8]
MRDLLNVHTMDECIEAIYNGEDNTLNIEVSDIEKAIWILSQPTLSRCPE